MERVPTFAANVRKVPARVTRTWLVRELLLSNKGTKRYLHPAATADHEFKRGASVACVSMATRDSILSGLSLIYRSANAVVVPAMPNEGAI